MQVPSLIGHTQELLGIILPSRKPADALIDIFFRSHKYLGSHDRKFIAEASYGTLRYLRTCELMVQSAIAEVNEKVYEEDKILFLIVAYFFLTGNKVNVTPEQISSKLKNKKFTERMAHVFDSFSKPLLLTNKSTVERIGVQYSFPDWIVQRLVEEYGEFDAEKICSSLNEQAPLTLRVNTLKTTVEQCQAELSKHGIEATKTPISPFGLNLSKRINVFSLSFFRDGWFEVQDEGSQLMPYLTDPKPNSKILDVCAGAGGKTLEFAALMKNRGEIFATDINKYRLKELRKRMKRAGAQNIRIQEIQAIEDLNEHYSQFFDDVFVDAPCSGLGTLRRNPGMKWMITEESVREVSEKQKSILESAAQLVKPGGQLLYATCTLLKQENEDVVEEFILRHPEFTFVDIEPMIGKWRIREVTTGSYFKLLPHKHGTDGFFCVVLNKQGDR